MYNSIQQFYESGIENLEKRVDQFTENPETLSDFVLGVGKDVLLLARNMIGEVLTDMNRALLDSRTRKLEWLVVRHENSTLLTSLGTVQYIKTVFRNRKTGKCSCLLDQELQLDAHERMTPDALARILETAVESSYATGGRNATSTGAESVSPQTVKNKLHALEFPAMEKPAVRKKVANLYVEADEDHLSLQFNQEKGDIRKDENGYRRTGFLSKLVYVYEGRQLVSEGRKKRFELTGVHSFSGVYEGSDRNRELWEEVSEYIESHYEIEEGGHIFLSGDGGGWIETARTVLGAETVMVMDRFHLKKYIHRALNCMGDASDDYSVCMQEVLESQERHGMEVLLDSMAEYLEDAYEGSDRESKAKTLEKSRTYILGNWQKITALWRYADLLHGCSAEGHVSHILSARMSSRPMGWSRQGADRMSRLRVYRENGGSMYDLAKYQKTARRTADNSRTEISALRDTFHSIRSSEKAAKNDLEKYYERFQATLTGRLAKKQALSILDLSVI